MCFCYHYFEFREVCFVDNGISAMIHKQFEKVTYVYWCKWLIGFVSFYSLEQ